MEVLNTMLFCENCGTVLDSKKDCVNSDKHEPVSKSANEKQTKEKLGDNRA